MVFLVGQFTPNCLKSYIAWNIYCVPLWILTSPTASYLCCTGVKKLIGPLDVFGVPTTTLRCRASPAGLAGLLGMTLFTFGLLGMFTLGLLELLELDVVTTLLVLFMSPLLYSWLGRDIFMSPLLYNLLGRWTTVLKVSVRTMFGNLTTFTSVLPFLVLEEEELPDEETDDSLSI